MYRAREQHFPESHPTLSLFSLFSRGHPMPMKPFRLLPFPPTLLLSFFQRLFVPLLGPLTHGFHSSIPLGTGLRSNESSLAEASILLMQNSIPQVHNAHSSSISTASMHDGIKDTRARFNTPAPELASYPSMHSSNSHRQMASTMPGKRRGEQDKDIPLVTSTMMPRGGGPT